MLKVGIIGLGFMGKMHFGVYGKNPKSKVVAIADVDRKKLSGDWSSIGGNIGDPSARNVDLSGIATYQDAARLVADPNVDVVDVCVPPESHAKWAIAALKAGKSVVCEKPIALSLKDAQRMVDAADRARGNLYIAQCLRFWPEYVAAKQIIDKGKYGKVNAATFRRVSTAPIWSWQNWYLDSKRSGGAITDLHIHDVDFINWAFGLPKAVFAQGLVGAISHIGIDEVFVNYIYGDRPAVFAEGSWMIGRTFPFSMTFCIELEKATLEMSVGKPLTLHTARGKAQPVPLIAGDGYTNEIDHFLRCIQAGKPSSIITPRQAMDALRVIEAEKKSVATGKVVAVR